MNGDINYLILDGYYEYHYEDNALFMRLCGPDSENSTWGQVNPRLCVRAGKFIIPVQIDSIIENGIAPIKLEIAEYMINNSNSRMMVIRYSPSSKTLMTLFLPPAYGAKLIGWPGKK